MSEENPLTALSENSFKGLVEALETKLLPMEQVSCPVQHHFAPGIYMREVFIPAGTFSIGHHQKTPHLNIFLKGAVKFIKPDGSHEILTAPMSFTAPPGRKVGLILEDMVWLNIYATDERDVEKLEEMFLDKSEVSESYLKLLPNNAATADQDDFLAALEELGVDAATVKEQSECVEDQTPFPDGVFGIQVRPSSIEGKGVFACAYIPKGDIIAPARINGKRTPLGRYANHAKNPNAEAVTIGDDMYFRALQDIAGNCGGFIGDEVTVDYRQVVRSNLCQV